MRESPISQQRELAMNDAAPSGSSRPSVVTLPPISALLASIPPEQAVPSDPHPPPPPPSQPLPISSRHQQEADWIHEQRRSSQPLPFTYGSNRNSFDAPSRPQFPSSQDRSPQLHYIPSGLVGDSNARPHLPPSPQSRHSHPPRTIVSRPRSNSLSMHPYGSPLHGASGSTAPSTSNGGWAPRVVLGDRPRTAERAPQWEREYAVGSWPESSAGGGGGKWEFLPPASSGDPSSPPYLARKRRLDPLYRPEHSFPHKEMFRPRAASISTTDEYRGIPAWASGDVRTRMGDLYDEMNPFPTSRYRGGSSESLLSLGSGSESGVAAWPARQGSRTPDLSGLQITAGSPRRGSFVSASIGPTASPYPDMHIPVNAVPGAHYPPPTGWSLVEQGQGLRDSFDENADLGTDVNARYACPHCPKRFARPSSLRIHIHSHTGEKPFSCDMCGRGFSVQSNLRRHLKIHASATTGLKTVASNSNLEERSSTDEGEREGGDTDEQMSPSSGGASGGEEAVRAI